VETRAQLQFLQEQGSDLVQGFFFSQPKEAHQLSEMALAGKF